MKRTYEMRGKAYNQGGATNVIVTCENGARLPDDMDLKECRVIFELVPEKTPGQIAFEANGTTYQWDNMPSGDRGKWERTAAAVLEDAIKRTR